MTLKNRVCVSPQPLKVAKTQSTVTTVGPCSPPPHQEDCSGMNPKSLRSLCHTEVETLWPGGFIEEEALRSYGSGLEIWAWPCLLWFWRGMENLQGKKALQMTSLNWAHSSDKGWDKILRASTASSFPRRLTGRTGEWKAYGCHNTVKLQCHGKIVYWAPGVSSWLI